VQFKLDFTSAHWEFYLANQTAQQSGFRSANMMIEQGCGETMQDTVDVMAQLATVMASDRGTVATLTATNAKLDAQLESSQEYIKMLKEEISNLKAKIKPT
jgi:phage shock protein A